MGAWLCVLAVLLDTALGEPRRGHPLVVFGGWATALERRWNRQPDRSGGAGVKATLLLVGGPVLVAAFCQWWLPSVLLWPLQVLVLWLAMAPRSLHEHALAVARPLARADLPAVGRVVSRDTAALDETGVATAATESVLENGADAVFATLFWFLLAGLPGVVAHRAANTLDAMWGYRSERYERFGKTAARLDDVLNWVPARLTALSYALCGQTRLALSCWRRQARQWSSPNAGPVMAAGAGALGVSLGGGAPYHGQWRQRPVLGEGPTAEAATIDASLRLLRRTLGLWLLVAVTGSVLLSVGNP
ncbi:cobalamin biosynthesis protein [Alcanivorax xiamenensis]|uniref:Cobalamin biosynthesis protein CobD n=1 Tax=Alcanivorax xiamenensis TaxID=1177156 RepID=A0ABQ6Y839_9GAMM|nr:cobalamin biosynthesis protein [Alcanivorax xiamenensis]